MRAYLGMSDGDQGPELQIVIPEDNGNYLLVKIKEARVFVDTGDENPRMADVSVSLCHGSVPVKGFSVNLPLEVVEFFQNLLADFSTAMQ